MNDKDREGVSDVYSHLIDLVGLDDTRIIYESLKGQQISFPKRFYKADYIAREVKRRYLEGAKLKDLAKEYDYTERYLRRLIGVVSD